LALKPVCKSTILSSVAAFATLALPAFGSPLVLTPATITVDLTQCEVQTCGSLPPNVTYNGPLSGFSGSVAAGEGISVTATGFPFPTLTSTVPLSGASALIDAELIYLIEVVPTNGDTTVSPVEIGVNGVGSTFATTIGTGNEANAFVELQLASDSGGDAVFDDIADILYNPGVANNVCQPGNSSNTRGAGFISPPPLGTAGISCSGSSVSGGFNETGSYSISTNSLYVVTLNEIVQVGTGSNNGFGQGPGTVQGSSFIDPTFTVPAGFQIDLSPGVGNTNAAAPEPGTWAMLSVGLGLLAAAKVRRVTRSTRAFAPTR
jgi:hypothetical protein